MNHKKRVYTLKGRQRTYEATGVATSEATTYQAIRLLVCHPYHKKIYNRINTNN